MKDRRIRRKHQGGPDAPSLIRDAAPPERWNHGVAPEVVDTGRQQVSRPVAALKASGKIDDAEAAAAERYYRDFTLALCGARDVDKVGTGGGQAGFSAAVIDAMTGYREASQAVGQRADALLRLVVVEEMSCRSLAERMGVGVEHMSGKVATVLEALADHYAAADKRRRGPAIARAA